MFLEKICYNQMEEEDNDAYHSFMKDVQHIMKIIESKIGKTFLERVNSTYMCFLGFQN